MKGEKDFQSALDEKRNYFTSDKTSFYGVNPLRRLCIAVMGPLFNALFAVFAFTVIAIIGYTYYSADNRIILADEIYADSVSAAREQGLLTGDRITSLGGKPVETFFDISQIISTHPDEDIPATVERDGTVLHLVLRPILEKSSAMGKIGVVNWIEPVIADIPSGGEAEKAGLHTGDLIVAVNGEPVFSTAAVFKLIGDNSLVRITFKTQSGTGGESLYETELTIPQNNNPLFSFAVPAHKTKTYSFFPAIAHGVTETCNMLALTIKSLGLLFRGAEITQAVSGPVRITVMIGDTVKTGFQAGFNTGIVSVFNLLALISISLFLMNLLPVPVLDGGIVLFSFIEIILRKPLKPKFLYYIQFVGIAFIAFLFILAIFSDTRYLLHKY
jgi:regulator of sigma E protease